MVFNAVFNSITVTSRQPVNLLGLDKKICLCMDIKIVYTRRNANVQMCNAILCLTFCKSHHRRHLSFMPAFMITKVKAS